MSLPRSIITGRRIAEYGRRPMRAYGFITILHHHPDGSPVLRGDDSLRHTASGFIVNTRFGWLLFMVRHRRSLGGAR